MEDIFIVLLYIIGNLLSYLLGRNITFIHLIKILEEVKNEMEENGD